MTKHGLYTILAFAGAVPFVASALLIVLGIDEIAAVGRLDAIASSYGLAIVSFLAGVHWATELYGNRGTTLNLFVISNGVLLFVWFAYVLVSIRWQLLSQALALVALVIIDVRLQRRAMISSGYLRTRLIATVLAAGSLGVIVVAR